MDSLAPESLYSTFGGIPHMDILPEQIIYYVYTLDTMNVEEVFFFKLYQSFIGPAHPDSYLLNILGITTPAYAVMRLFGQNQDN